MIEEGDDGNILKLSSQALSALKEFYEEEAAREEAAGQARAMLKEDWNLSQFWYTEETASALAREALSIAEGRRIACISTPSVYQACLRQSDYVHGQATLFEYDRRFSSVGKDYVFYDFCNPLDLGVDIQPDSYSVVVVDPPFLSEECLRKTSETVKFLTSRNIILCTDGLGGELRAIR